MTYSIRITNKNIDYDVTPEILDLSTISPTLTTDPNTPYVEYQSDIQNESTSVFIPLYKRSQYVELKAGSILVINTDDTDEAIYYRNIVLDNVTILCDPDPMGGGSSGPVLIDKTITENGVYNAEDDDADGYSSVSVEVSGGGFSYAVATSGTGGSGEVTGFFTSDSGDYYFEGGYEYAPGDYIVFSNGTIILCDPLRTFEHLSGFDTGRIIFTPASDYVGFFYNEASGESPTITGDTITAGDGKRYTLTISRNSSTGVKSFVIEKSSNEFECSIG